MATTILQPAPARPQAPPAKHPAAERLLSLDFFRGLTMLLLVSNGFGIHEAFKNNANLFWLADQFEHRQWVGCTLWDLIQPAFTFIVGVAMPIAFARRAQEGASSGAIFQHVLWRAFALILLSNILMNWGKPALKLQFINVLSQIAFAYVMCFAIMQLRFTWQVATAAAIMVFHHALFFLFPGPAGPFDPQGNVGAQIDQAILGYKYSGNYTTINFLGNGITVLFGVWAGMLLSKPGTHRERLRILGVCAAAAFALGLALAPFIPMVKRLWLGSFTFFSAGWVLVGLMASYWAIEVKGWRGWTFPALVVGANCIFIYSFSQVLRGWLNRGLAAFTKDFSFVGEPGLILQNVLVMSVMWYLCYWLWQRKIFFKL